MSHPEKGTVSFICESFGVGFVIVTGLMFRWIERPSSSPIRVKPNPPLRRLIELQGSSSLYRDVWSSLHHLSGSCYRFFLLNPVLIQSTMMYHWMHDFLQLGGVSENKKVTIPHIETTLSICLNNVINLFSERGLTPKFFMWVDMLLVNFLIKICLFHLSELCFWYLCFSSLRNGLNPVVY